MHNLPQIVSLYRRYKEDWQEDFSSTFINEFFFCLLGGFQITFELNKSSFNLLKQKSFFEKSFFENNSPTNRVLIIENELNKKQFKTGNNKHSRYRFPKKGAQKLSNAGQWFLDKYDWRDNWVYEEKPIKLKRAKLCTCPGIGMKTSSWILRNLLKDADLLILDIHVMRILKALRVVPCGYKAEKDYLKIERRYLELCSSLELNPAKFDLFLWEYSRGRKNEI